MSMDQRFIGAKEQQRRAQLERFLTDEVTLEQGAPATPTTPAPTAPERKPFILEAAGKAVFESVAAGGKNLAEGIYPGRPRASDLRSQASGVGQGLLGALQIATAPFPGLMAGVTQAIRNWTPESGETVVLPGGENSPAGYARAILGVAGLALDPATRAADPRDVAAMLNAPMTLDEFLGTLAGFAAPVAAPKLLPRSLKGAKEVAPAAGEATPAVKPQLALPPHPKEPLVTPPPISMTPNEVAIELRTILEQIPKPEATPVTREAARVQGRTPLEAPLRAPEPVPTEAAVPEGPLKSAVERVMEGQPERPGDLSSAMDIAVRRSEQLIAQEIKVSGEAGSVDSLLLARLALGAAAGGTQGDTPEERILNMFLGMGLSAALSPRLARGVITAYKESRLADETGAVNFGAFRPRPAVQASEQAFQANVERLAGTPELLRLTKNIHRMAQEEILARKGQPKTTGETVQAAHNLIIDNKMTPDRILSMGADEMLTREEMTAARMIAHRSRGYIREVNEAFKAGTATEQELFDAFSVSAGLSRNVRVAQTRVAQAEQASAIKIDDTFPQAFKAQDVAHLSEALPDGVTGKDLSAMLDTLKTDVAQEHFASWSTLLPRATLEAFYFSLLSGKALIKNAIGNLVMMPLGIAVRTVQPYMPRLGKVGPATYPGEGAQMAMGWAEGLADLARGAHRLRDWSDAYGLTPAVKLEGLPSRAVSADTFGITAEPLATLTDYLGKGLALPSEVMRGTDTLSKAMNGRMQHRIESFRQAAQEGLDGEAFWDRVDALNNNPALLREPALGRIRDFADRQTFTKDFEGRIGQALSRGPADPWVNLLYRTQVLPFFRTPVRIGETALEHTPGLNLAAAHFWQEIRSADPVRVQAAQGRLLVGTALMTGFGYLALQGLVTGTRPRDPKMAALWHGENMSEKSFRFPGSTTWHSYDGFEPYTTWIATAADVVSMAKNLPDEESYLQLFIAGLLSQINNIDSKTYTGNLSEFLDVMKTPGPEGQVQKALDMFRRRIASPLVPGALREIRSATDQMVRRVRPHGDYPNALQREFNSVLRDMQNRFPGASGRKDEAGNWIIEPVRDPLTGEIQLHESLPFVPTTARTQRENPAYIEMRRLGAPVDLRLPDYMGGAAPGAQIGLVPEKGVPGQMLTPAERDRRAVLMTQVVRDPQGRLLNEAMNETIASDQYKQYLSDGPLGGKVDELQRIWREFRRAAELQLRVESSELDKALITKEHERAILKAPMPVQPSLRDLSESLRR